jgi:hypothetical protein
MSAEPVSDSSHGAAALEVRRAVAAARRRLRTVAMLRLAAVAAPAGVTAGVALALAGPAPAWAAGVLGLLGAVAAAAWAAIRTPTLATVARQLDTRLGLRDRVAAALQLQQTGGPVAALVARDAAARLAPIRMATVFPLALGRIPAVAAAIAVASVAWLMSIDAGTSRATLATAPGTRDAASADAGSPVRDGAPSNAPAAEARARSATAPARAPEPRATDGRGTTPREAFSPAPARGDRPTTAAARETSDAPRAAGGGSRDGNASSAAARAPRPGARGGAGAGRAARGGLTPGAGGVASGNALAADAGSTAPGPGIGSYRTARAGAEAALARDVIPPDYRDHVRAYFRALGQEGTR